MITEVKDVKGGMPNIFSDFIGDVYLFLPRTLPENKKNSMGNIRLRRIKVAHPTVELKENERDTVMPA